MGQKGDNGRTESPPESHRVRRKSFSTRAYKLEINNINLKGQRRIMHFEESLNCFSIFWCFFLC